MIRSFKLIVTLLKIKLQYYTRAVIFMHSCVTTFTFKHIFVIFKNLLDFRYTIITIHLHYPSFLFIKRSNDYFKAEISRSSPAYSHTSRATYRSRGSELNIFHALWWTSCSRGSLWVAVLNV